MIAFAPDLRALSCITRRPRLGNSCSTSKSFRLLFKRKNLFKQPPKGRNVPLPVSEVGNNCPSVSSSNSKRFVERPARTPDSQLFVEHKHRLTHGVNDALGIGEGFSEWPRLRLARCRTLLLPRAALPVLKCGHAGCERICFRIGAYLLSQGECLVWQQLANADGFVLRGGCGYCMCDSHLLILLSCLLGPIERQFSGCDCPQDLCRSELNEGEGLG